MVIEQAFFFRSAPFSFQDWGASSRFNFLAQSIFEFATTTTMSTVALSWTEVYEEYYS